ncbi:unnamed protein product [Parascedosporium putredinis]|uniref:Major facilitator superfamily (MFS) profile domain-containing protein n=1 Tax=Parascedosporium putredinis TaxID=1442378 RepID=A0A9P1H1R5_9PEZI|nr:unnamed protein product [Parascedosporium putredinis]CAI7994030.1 unnamed protein product [Parascedosporium putredinis]
MSFDIPRKLWEHPAPETTAMFKFKTNLERQTGLHFKDFEALHAYSIANRSDFWRFTFTQFPIVWHGHLPAHVVDESASVETNPKWFPGVKLNYAQNVLFSGDEAGRPTKRHKEDDRVALTEVREGGSLEPQRRVTNSIDTLVVFLATASLGALFSSSSADMGIKGILDRLLQIRPTYVFFDDWAVYNGKTIDLRPKIKETIAGLRAVPEFRSVIAQARFPGRPNDVSSSPGAKPHLYRMRLFRPSPHRLLVRHDRSPKCIVHAVGGLVMNAHKEGRLHHCVDETSVKLQYTTTGWIMYMQVPSALILGAHPVLYDGSPFVPDARVLLRLVHDLRVTHLGISPRYLEELRREKIAPRDDYDLSALAVVVSTGMVLPEALFHWFYDHMSLGMDVQVFSPEGARMPDGEPGELVCVQAFPTMPVSFFGEGAAAKYRSSYFERFPGIWTHGDFIQVHPVTRQVNFLGRSDGVLNPSGVRFGSAEIYNVVNAHFADRVADSVCVGQRRPQDSDERVLLFLLMKEGHRFTKALAADIKQAIRKDLSPRHVPAYVFETPEIPTTVNMKKVELPVKQILSAFATIVFVTRVRGNLHMWSAELSRIKVTKANFPTRTWKTESSSLANSQITLATYIKLPRMADPITTSRETNNDGGGHIKEKMQADNSSIEGTVLHQDQEQGAVDGFSPEEEKKLLRKVDWALLPLLSFLYLVSFIDRSNIGNAKVAGLTDDLDMKGMQYNTAVTLFFVPYTLFEVPSNILLKMMRPSLWISIILLCWGTVMTLMGLVNSYSGLLAGRFFLGLAEAGFFPAASYLLTIWYKRYEYQRRLGIFYAAASMSGAFSGLLAFAIEKMAGIGGRTAWQWIFILEGLVPVLCSVVVYFCLADSPETAGFLTPRERKFIVDRVAGETGSDQGQVTNNDKISWAQIKAGLSEWKAWVMILVYWGNSVGVYGFTATAPTVVKDLGYSSANAQLMTIPVYAFGVVMVLVVALVLDRGMRLHRAARHPHPKYPGVTYAFLFPVAGGLYGGFPPMISWLANNLSPSSKRAVGLALLISVGNMGGLMGSNIYLSREAPVYHTGYGVSLTMLGVGILAAIALRISYARENKLRDELLAEIGEEGVRARYTEQELLDLGDKSPFFRYTL